MNTVTVKSTLPDRYEIREAFKALRTNVMFTSSDIKTIVITSTTQNEGKSVISFELAKSLADAGKKVLLLDADLRKSLLSTRHTTETGMIGLSHYLSGQCELEEILYQTQHENFFIAFSGPFPPNPVELIGNTKFDELIKIARERFDYILIDTPPVGYVIDGAVVAAQCDGVIFVIAENRVSHRAAQAAKHQLERSGCRILGSVLSMSIFEAEHGGSYKYKYRRYYYGYKYGHYYAANRNQNFAKFAKLDK